VPIPHGRAGKEVDDLPRDPFGGGLHGFADDEGDRRVGLVGRDGGT
jgi:hypothetical protein